MVSAMEVTVAVRRSRQFFFRCRVIRVFWPSKCEIWERESEVMDNSKVSRLRVWALGRRKSQFIEMTKGKAHLG